MSTRVRPLVAREGARFRCGGDALCCTDAHALGPLTRREIISLRRRDARSVIAHARLDAAMIRPLASGACTYLDGTRCRLHAEDGARAKPVACRRFPFRLVATPNGGRITTAQRSPCRSMGERPAIDVGEAMEALSDGARRLVADVRAPERMPVTDRRSVSFDAWVEIERPVMARLANGEQPAEVLAREQMPELDGVSWTDVAHHFRGGIDGTACGDALAWAGDVLLAIGGERRAMRARPWSASFDRAEARAAPPAGEARAAQLVVGDWLADEIWGLAWLERGSFARACTELSVRARIAEEMTRMLIGAGARADRAAAEAVLVAELAGESTLWARVVGQLRARDA